MDPSDEPPAFQGSTRVGRSPLPAYAIIVGAVLLVGIGFLSSLTEDEDDGLSSPLPTTSAPVAAATTRPTPRPTPVPTPEPTLAPTAAPVTTARLAPPAVLVADIGGRATGDLVAATDGTVWTTREGGVVNFDPESGLAREWTLADDPAFATASLAASRAGGVWMVGPDAIRRFDGVRFRAVIEAPAEMWALVEDPGGSLWAQTDDCGLVRWADGVWASDPAGRPGRGAADIVVDADGRVWTIDLERHLNGDETLLGISMWDGSGWTSFATDDLPGLPRRWDWDATLIASGDGSVWVRAGGRMARFRAGRWAGYEVGALDGVSLRAVGDDGRLWFVQEDCPPEPCGVRIHAYDGATLTTYDEEDGLPGAGDVDWPGAVVMAGTGFVLASTDAGLYRLTDGSWQRVELSSLSDARAPGSSPPDGVWDLAASSRDEVWAVAEPDDRPTDARPGDGLFHFDGGAWHPEPLPVDAVIGRMAIDPDGTLWVATSSGPLVRREGTWLDLGDAVGRVAPGSIDDDTGCGGTVSIGDGVVYYAGPRSANRLVELRPVGDAWEASLHPAPTLNGPCWSTLAATADGTIWLLERGWGNTLSRSVDGGPWEEVPLPPVERTDSSTFAAAIAADRDGSLWVVTQAWEAWNVSHAAVWQVDEGRWIRRGGGGGIGHIGEMVPLVDGSLLAVGEGLARFDGGHWRRTLGGIWLSSLSVAPDGAVWVAGPNVYRLPPPLP